MFAGCGASYAPLAPDIEFSCAMRRGQASIHAARWLPDVPAKPIENTFFSLLERLSERITTFVSGHWGTLTAVVLLALGGLVFLWDPDDHLASSVERVMTMLSLALLFLLQRSQTKATLSLQVKLNEILKSMHETDNHVINVERLSEEELKEVHDGYEAIHGRPADEATRP
jgi:low affinity Fe/Cu permease